MVQQNGPLPSTNTPVGERGLGRLILEDERDKNFQIRALLPRAVALPTWRYWWAQGWWGDQGSTNQCVAYAFVHKFHDGPYTMAQHVEKKYRKTPIINPRDLYCAAQAIDPWPGDCNNWQYEGTSVRAGAKVMQDWELIREYRWAWDADTVIDCVRGVGPVVLGTYWYAGMSWPTPEGFLKAEGVIQGAHAYIINGVNMTERKVRMKNSWGRWWGVNGSAWITFDDLDKLMRNAGEACLPIR